MKRLLALVSSHAAAGAIGFGVGIYALPILTAPSAPSTAELAAAAAAAQYKGRFRRELKDSDALHWGEGEVTVGARAVTHRGRLAPGPDYKLYLSPRFVETEAEFMATRAAMVRLGDVKSFDGFIVAVPEGVDVAAYDTVIVWCESFGQFISAAQYR
jgi:hypothetical protein